MKSQRTIFFFLIILLTGAPVAADSWTAELTKGGVISVDPRTNKATIYTEQGTTPLWDGTHRLRDGSVVIVKEGVVTSGGRPPSAPPKPSKFEKVEPVSSSACVELVIRTCGFNGECRAETSCSAARQLMQLEKDEAWQTRSKGPNQTSVQCREALATENFFKRCEILQSSDSPTPCQRLVTSICGARNQCGGAATCAPAQQLLVMETQERLISRDPDRHTYTSKRCLESIENSNFFKPCNRGAE